MGRIILAFDSFKGSLSSSELADVAEQAIKAIGNDYSVEKVIMADGGEGTLDALIGSNKDKFRVITKVVSDPLMRPVNARYAISQGGCAIIELAEAAGLPLLTQQERNPLLTSTYGVGELIMDAVSEGCKEILLSVGGSATNDGGIGIMAALGVRFLDTQGVELSPIGENLDKINKIDFSGKDSRLDGVKFTIACDVNSLFYGSNGAAQVYAPQKGANAADVKYLDNGLRTLSKLLAESCGVDISTLRGAGAAGGVAGGLVAMLGAQLSSGIDMVLDAVDFDSLLVGADMVITGEGRIDSQSFNGKVISGIAARAKRTNTPVIALGGSVRDEVSEINLSDYGISRVIPIQPASTPLEIAMNPENTKECVARTVKTLLLEG